MANPAQAQAQEFISVKGAGANVREQPSTKATTLWELNDGYPLQVIQRKSDWLQVKDFEATLGWIYAPRTQKVPHMVITAKVANLRAGPTQQHKVVSKLEAQEIVKTLKKSNDWVQVERSNGQQGWIASNLAWGW
nr:SH3 domain-containing protein [Giesbergeria anulus]